jgi:hypothetical protein
VLLKSPWEVSRRTSEPSVRILCTSSRLLRVLSKTSQRPSGDQLGSSSRPGVVGQAALIAAVRIHQIDLAVAVAQADKGQLTSIGVTKPPPGCRNSRWVSWRRVLPSTLIA